MQYKKQEDYLGKPKYILFSQKSPHSIHLSSGNL